MKKDEAKLRQEEELIDSFFYCCRDIVRRAIKNPDNPTDKDKIDEAIFHILCLLDGVSGQWNGDISKLDKASKNMMLHELWYDEV